ncbi:hypothetical protein BPS26883_06440 [Burkholderia pseudomultivorans]|uniref:Uncharacterized protein n=1 Tax=Burkholderia pseudomultivorans TaxID=1207504 RepID=A0A6P2R928_9BURK|nr:hypothetical protein BPS26883_06440 [Burkholderia pseudomultivorans]
MAGRLRFLGEYGGDHVAHVGPRAQRRQLEGRAAQPVIQVLAERTVRDHLHEIAVRRTDHVEIDAHRRVAAERHDLAVGEHAQQARLQRERHVADFVEKQRAAVGQRDLAARAVLARAGERAGRIAEQLALDQRFRQRAAVDGDERPRAARAGIVNRACEHFLARAGFAEHENRQPLARDAQRQFGLLGDLRVAAAQERRERADLALGGARAARGRARFAAGAAQRRT